MTDPPDIRPGRRIHGIAALLLPFDADGRADLDGLASLVRRATEAGLDVAVNMDTGFGPDLTPDERRAVLHVTRDGLGPDASFVAGAMPFGRAGDPEDAYRQEVRAIVGAGAVPVVFPSEAMAGLGEDALVDLIARVTADAPQAIAFELGGMFASFGRLFGPEVARRLMSVENIVGLKHSSLNRQLEWELLRIRDTERPGFQIFSGNDLAIDMVCYGSDYLLGLATFDVKAFAQRDRWWAASDSRFPLLNEALQAIGDVAFRDPVLAYKHDAALYLKLTAQLHDPYPHPACPRRPDDETDRLRALADGVAEVMATTS